MNTKTRKPTKQRKRLYQGALHTKRKLIVAPIDKKLREQIGKKSISVRKGDTVKILVGSHKGKSGKVEKVDYSKAKVFVKEIIYKTNKGVEKLLPLTASNLVITDVVLDDLKRLKKTVKVTQKKAVKTTTKKTEIKKTEIKKTVKSVN